VDYGNQNLKIYWRHKAASLKQKKIYVEDKRKRKMASPATTRAMTASLENW
jgi:hypothetical protein